MTEFIDFGTRDPGNLVNKKEVYVRVMAGLIEEGHQLEVYHYSMQQWFDINSLQELKDFLRDYGNQTFAFRITGEGNGKEES